MTQLQQTFKLSVVALSLTLAACGSSSSNNEPEVVEPPAPTTPEPTPVVQGEINGPFSTGSISESKFVYWDLDAGEVVELTEEEAATDTVWDVAFKRTSVFLNSNNADNPVSVYDTGNNADFWDAEGNAVVDSFVNATADSEKQEYLDVDTTAIPTDDTMFSNDVTDHILDGYYTYDFATHTVSANAENFFIVKNNDMYTKFAVTGLTQDGRVASDFTLSVSYDFADSVELMLDGAAICTGDATHAYVDFATASVVAADAAHDLTVACGEGGFDFDMNIADSAVAYQDFSNNIADADTASTYSSYGYFKTNQYTTAAFGDLNWYAYGIQGNHKLWSKFGVYVIKTGDKHFKFQITSYYDEEGNSGNYSFRADELVAE